MENSIGSIYITENKQLGLIIRKTPHNMKAFTIAAIFVLLFSGVFVHSQNLSGTNLDDFIDAIIKKK